MLFVPLYARSLHEFFRRYEMTDREWLENESRVYKILDQYQKDGFHELMAIANRYRGAFLCDGVGLGKTFIGLMLIEYLIERQRKRVALFVPKAARESVWERLLDEYLPHISAVTTFSNLDILNHSDLLRGGKYPARLQRVKEMADIILVDEAHHFRNPGIKGEEGERKSHYWQLYDIADGKTLFLLTATPVNNRLIDFQHMMELFSRRQTDYFKDAPLGIHSLPGHFRRMENELERMVLRAEADTDDEELVTDEVEAEKVLAKDDLFRALVVQRSRAYVKKSQQQYGGTSAIFPARADPQVVPYSIKKTYGNLLGMVEKAFNKKKPLFSLAVYYPLAYYKGPNTAIDPLRKGRQNQVVSLIRTQFLKRFESSAHAFRMSCEALLLKLLAWVIKNEPQGEELKRFERWKTKYGELIGYVQAHQRELFGAEFNEEEEEDIVPAEMIEEAEALSREEYKVDDIINETIDDLGQIGEFLTELQKFKPAHDDKLKALIRLLKTDPVLKKRKVLIFTEYMATARYLKQQLEEAGIDGVDEVDSASECDRGDIIRQFSPYYNQSSSAQLEAEGLQETRVLISTDVLSEGLNLQDATRLINYDLHWNPVRLMQRIGRVDRRMHPAVEAKIVADHPEERAVRGTVAFWNFLPPDELDDLLQLYGRVTHKVLRISKTFGIEGRKLLKPEDDFEALRDFTRAYEGTTTPVEEMHLEYQKLIQKYPDLIRHLESLPGRVFSGKAHPSKGGKAVFFCYAMPAPPGPAQGSAEKARLLNEETTSGWLNAGPVRKAVPLDEAVSGWSEEAGETKWYLFDLASERVSDVPTEIVNLIRSTPDTPRKHDLPESTLSQIRAKVEKHIKNTYLKQVQAPVGVKAKLKAWMELS